MPDFVAALATAALFCVAVPMVNGLTRLALHFHLGPADLAESGPVQYGLALILARLLWRRVSRTIA